MGSITMVRIRAKISIGGLSAETPFIRSFNVSKSRGQVSTFNAVLKVPHDSITDNIVGDSVVIEAGEGSPNIKVFTGMVRQAKISPCWDDPYYVDLALSGSDRLSYLQGKKFTRRCRSTRASWVSIDSVVRRGLKSGKFKYIERPVLETSKDEPVSDGHQITATRNMTIPDAPKSGQKRDVLISATGIRSTTTAEEGR